MNSTPTTNPESHGLIPNEALNFMREQQFSKKIYQICDKEQQIQDCNDKKILDLLAAASKPRSHKHLIPVYEKIYANMKSLESPAVMESINGLRQSKIQSIINGIRKMYENKYSSRPKPVFTKIKKNFEYLMNDLVELSDIKRKRENRISNDRSAIKRAKELAEEEEKQKKLAEKEATQKKLDDNTLTIEDYHNYVDNQLTSKEIDSIEKKYVDEYEFEQFMEACKEMKDVESANYISDQASDVIAKSEFHEFSGSVFRKEPNELSKNRVSNQKYREDIINKSKNKNLKSVFNEAAIRMRSSSNSDSDTVDDDNTGEDSTPEESIWF